MNFELSGGASALSIVVLSLFIVCFCYVSLFNVLYAVLYEVGSDIELLSSLGPLHLVAAVGSTARQSAAGPTSE